MKFKKPEEKWLALMIVLVGSFMTTLDISIVNVALPKMSENLSVDMGTIQWVVTSYLLVISTLVLIFGRIADMLGKKLIYQNGFIIFSLGSLWCVFSSSLTFLLLGRIVQGIGAAMMMSCNFGIITMVFPKEERGRATGILGTIVAIGTMTGPPLGGFLVSAFNWQAIFIINIPIGILTYFFGAKYLPKDIKQRLKEGFDTIGSILFILVIVPLIYSLLSGEKLGWRSPIILFCLILCIISFILFITSELHSKAPMLDLSLFRNKFFSAGIFCAFISYTVIYFTNIIQPFYLQHILNMSPEKAGLIMAIYPVTAAVAAPLSGFLSDKIGYKLPTIIGLTATCIGVLTMSFLNLHSTIIDIAIRMTILGAGYGLFQSPNTAGVMSSVPSNKLGISGSMNSLTRNLGMTCGISVSVALFSSKMSFLLGRTVTGIVAGRPELFITSMNYVYIISALIALPGVIIAALRTINREKKFQGSITNR